MNSTQRGRWDPFAWFLLAVIASVAIYGGLGTYLNGRADSRRQTAVNGAQSHLLDCFDRFASQLAGGLPPVREASAARDDARAVWENASDAVSTAIEKALERAATGAPTDGSQVPVILNAFHDLDMASAALDKANANLDRVRAANPYPPPPSEFCAA